MCVAEEARTLTDVISVYERAAGAPAIPVNLEATVLYSAPDWRMMFIRDHQRGIFVRCKEPPPVNAKLGSRIKLEGMTDQDHHGTIGEAQISFLSAGPAPTPISTTLSGLDRDAMGSGFVEIDATVQSVILGSSWIHLFVKDSGAWAEVFIRDVENSHGIDLEKGKRIRLSGALGIVSDQNAGPLIFSQSLDQIRILDHSSNPEQSQPSTLNNRSQLAVGNQLSLSATSINRMQEGTLYVESALTGIKVNCPGVRLIGLNESLMIEGVVTAVNPGVEIDAHRIQVIESGNALTPPTRMRATTEDSYRRIRLSGKPSSINAKGNQASLLLESAHGKTIVTIEATEDEIESLALEDCEQISVAGTLTWINRGAGFQAHLLVPSTQDINVIAAPPEVNYFRSLYVAVALCALLLIGLVVYAWTKSLRLQVNSKTRDILDVTARLRSAYHASRDAIIVADTAGEAIEFNSKVTTLLGIKIQRGDRVEDIVQELFSRAEHPAVAKRHWARSQSQIPIDDTFELHIPEPNEKFFEVHIANVVDSENRIEGQRVTFHDVTKRTQLENSLVQAQKMEAIGRLAGGIAHDFNNLLTGISGNLEVAKLNRDKPLRESEHYLDSAESAARRAAELIKQLLGYSRKSSLDRKPGNVNDVAKDLLDLIKHSLDASIEVTSNLSEDLWMALIDGVHIEQVLMNLCVNARDALPVSGGTINVSTENVTRSEGDFVKVTVEDNGKGIPESVQKRIFEPFFTTKDQGKGTGLGLAMSFGIIQQHHGLMECESVEGQGTKFHIFLPRAEANPVKIKPIRPIEFVRCRNPRHILLADDEAVVRAVGEGMLRHHGYTVSSVSNGREAMEFLATTEDKIDLIITDLTMPQMTGKELLIQVRDRHPEIPIIICSGYLVDLDAFAQEAGTRPDGFVAKPFEMNTFLAEVGRCLESIDERLAVV